MDLLDSLPRLFVIGFALLAIWLMVSGARHSNTRGKALDGLMMDRGFLPIVEPCADELIPEDIFYPNGFSSRPGSGQWGYTYPRVLRAWSGPLLGNTVTVMDVTLNLPWKQVNIGDNQKQLNRTLIRWRSDGASPPEFLLREEVLSSSKGRDVLPVGGHHTLGERYLVRSRATSAEIARWISPATCNLLSQHRHWQVAAHPGTLFLTRDSSWLPVGEMSDFLESGGQLLSCMVEQR